ncbi:AfsR/SARP family transcriptional regulator [Xylanimonas oleitrophica]|uniref:AfsR/SARP family transcriptional regulator n=1 Tax=Xylanimonas oleitrophica TaxID=2607479 RepID=UPI001FE45A9F|nr:BTAD domain-containing putative transcriptional regulator [Xylanimonas oleitrophica]
MLGPVAAWHADGTAVPLRGPRHRELLGRLVAARGRTVALDELVTDLWGDPLGAPSSRGARPPVRGTQRSGHDGEGAPGDGGPRDATAAVRTFVAALRRSLEPGRAPRTPARVLVTDGPGYALRLPADAVDARRLEAAVAGLRGTAPGTALHRADDALALWRGTPYAGIDAPWARTERARLTELRLDAVERRADALLTLGRAAEAVADLNAHTAAHPWREEGWRLLALALYRSGRQADALAVLRRARRVLAETLGVDPGPALARLETQVLRHEAGATAPADVWDQVADAYTQGPGARVRLESSAELLRSLAVTGGLTQARERRLDVVRAAEQHGDPELTARVLTAYDVPGTWTRSDDAAQAAEVAAAAERTLAALPDGAPQALRARLLAVVATETRGLRGERGPAAARDAVRLARASGDPAALVTALAALALHTCGRAGLAAERDAVGVQVLDLADRHGLPTAQILGHLLRMQARGALDDLDGAAAHAEAASRLGERHERPLVGVLTTWFAAMRLAAQGAPAAEVEDAYRAAARGLEGAGMPGMAEGLEPLAVLCLHVGRLHGRAPEGRPGGAREGASGGAREAAGRAAGAEVPAVVPVPVPVPDVADDAWGPYLPWARPWALLAAGRRGAAAAALRRVPEPPPGLLLEALWVLTGRAAVLLDDVATARRARAALLPAAGQLAGAGSGALTAGPVDTHLAVLDELLADQPG